MQRSLTNVMRYRFALQNINPIYIKHQEVVRQKYSKEYLEQFNQNPNFEADAIRNKKEKAAMEFKESITNTKFNDKLVENRIKEVKIRNNDKLKEYKDALKKEEKVEIYRVQPRESLPTSYAIRRSCRSSLKKLHLPCRSILKKHLYDAIMTLNEQETKASKYMLNCLLSAKENAKNKEMDLDRMYVKTVCIGKHRRMRGVRYHAKMRHGNETSDICQIRISLEEKPIRHLYESMMNGRTPVMLSYLLRQKLVSEGADYKTIVRHQGMIHSKGKQQLKLMVKRRVMQQYMQFKAKGVKVPKKIIQKRLLEKNGREYEEQYLQEKSDKKILNIAQRQKIFDINEAASQ